VTDVVDLPVAVTDKAITKAVGAELRRAREARGWSRAQFVRLLPSGVGERTLLAYEHGLRQLTVPRLNEISQVLEIDAPTVMARGLAQARICLENLPLHVDLHALLGYTGKGNGTFRPMVQWARNMLSECPGGIVEVEPAVVRNLAVFIGRPHRELATYLARFTPPTVPEPVTDFDEPEATKSPL
jgi:transcriptional regulator with XRE-family HTH domain